MKHKYLYPLCRAILVACLCLHTARAQDEQAFTITWKFDGDLTAETSNPDFRPAAATLSPGLTLVGYEDLEGTNKSLIAGGWTSQPDSARYIEVAFTPLLNQFHFNGVNARLKRSGGGPSQVRVTLTITRFDSTVDSATVELGTYNLTTEDYTNVFVSPQAMMNQRSTFKLRYYGLSAPGPVNTLTIDYIRVFGLRTATPLPVHLIAFEARQQGSAVQLAWETAWEVNSKEFVVERSADLSEFMAIGTVPAGGFTDGPRQYFFTDPSPLLGINYYRLRSIDTDNTYEYYKPTSVVYRPGQPFITIAPNPVKDRRQIRVMAHNIDPFSLRLTSMLGQVLPHRVVEERTGHWAIVPQSPLASGMYFLTGSPASTELAVFPFTTRIVVE